MDQGLEGSYQNKEERGVAVFACTLHFTPFNFSFLNSHSSISPFHVSFINSKIVS